MNESELWKIVDRFFQDNFGTEPNVPVSYTHLRAHET